MTLQRPECATLRSTLAAFSEYLSGKAVDSPRLSAEVIMAHVLGVTRLDILTRPEQLVDEEQWNALSVLVLRRGVGEPVSYLTGVQEFYGRDFAVTSDTLIPRPETEHLIEEIVARLGNRKQIRFADLGTGSGCIATTLCCELPQASGLAVDYSQGALQVARGNAQSLGVANRLAFVRGDFTTPLLAANSFDLIATNPPYVSEQEYAELSPEVRDFEPRSALVPGSSGLEYAEQLIRNAVMWLKSDGVLIMEMGYWQAEQHLSYLEQCSSCWSEKVIIKDLSGHNRLTLAVRA